MQSSLIVAIAALAAIYVVVFASRPRYEGWFGDELVPASGMLQKGVDFTRSRLIAHPTKKYTVLLRIRKDKTASLRFYEQIGNDKEGTPMRIELPDFILETKMQAPPDTVARFREAFGQLSRDFPGRLKVNAKLGGGKPSWKPSYYSR